MSEMERLVKILIDKKKTIASMESCTGGEFASEVTNIDGSSEILKFSAVTYSNEFKIKMGVDKDIIDKYSVYSMETAKDMSKKICDFTGSNYGVGITGKINRIDKNNMYGNDSMVFVSIYDRDNDKYYTMTLEAIDADRDVNKEIIIDNIFLLLLNII